MTRGLDSSRVTCNVPGVLRHTLCRKAVAYMIRGFFLAAGIEPCISRGSPYLGPTASRARFLNAPQKGPRCMGWGPGVQKVAKSRCVCVRAAFAKRSRV